MLSIACSGLRPCLNCVTLGAMLRATQHSRVTRFDLARTFLGRRRYWTAAYLVACFAPLNVLQ